MILYVILAVAAWMVAVLNYVEKDTRIATKVVWTIAAVCYTAAMVLKFLGIE